MAEAGREDVEDTSAGRSGTGVPVPGTSVTLVPAGEARLLTGTLLSWEESGSSVGAEAEAGVDIAPSSAQGGPAAVWATLEASDGDIVVLSADAYPGETRQSVLLSGRIAAREPRRRSVRAAAQLEVDLTLPGGESAPISGHTLDLSTAGCRISLESAASATPAVEPGEPTEVTIHLDRSNRPRLSGYVHGLREGQIVVRFRDVPGPVAEQIQRYVYATLP